MPGAPQPRRVGDEELPLILPRRLARRRFFFPAMLVIGLAALFWPVREVRSDNFVFYLPSGHQMLPLENVGTAKYLPLIQVLNVVGKVGGIQEKKNSLKVWFGQTVLTLEQDNKKVAMGSERAELHQPVHLTDGQWMVPVDFLTIVLPRLTHQTVEYQEGTNRIFVGDVKPTSFTVHVDPVANGARLTVQFTDKVTVRTASSNGKWVMFLGDHPMEPTEPAYHFQNPYISDLRYDDQDGVAKFILSPTSAGLNFYPAMAEGGKVLLADIERPPSTMAQGLSSQPAPGPQPSSGQPAAGPTPQATEETPAVPPGPPLPVVALDPGHGGDDNGGHSHDGVWEKNLVAQYAARVRAALLATEKFRVVLTRTGDVSAANEQRALAANLSGATCFISFHAGDLGTSSPRINIYTFEAPSPPASLPADLKASAFLPWGQVQETRLGSSVQLAGALQQQLAQISGLEADTPATAPVLTLRSVNAPAVAIELGPLSTDTDAVALTNPAFQQQVASAIARGIASFEKGGN